MCCLTYIYFEFYFSGCQFLTNIFPDFDQIFKKLSQIPVTVTVTVSVTVTDQVG